MKELKELVEQAERADSLCLLMQNVNPHHILAVDDEIKALKQRAEAAEAYAAEGWRTAHEVAAECDELKSKLAGLDKLAGEMLNRSLNSTRKQAVAYAECADILAKHAATLRNIEELVPVYQQHFYGSWHDCDKGEYDCAEEGSRRVLYMRNIEEKSK